MAKTKTGKVQYIQLPKSLLEILKWHQKTQIRLGAPSRSDLLFPSTKGGFQSRTTLKKPFQKVSKLLDLGYEITPYCMRRTSQDLLRQAQVNDIVLRSISGHATPSMTEHYSTVAPAEQEQALAAVVDMFTKKRVA